MTSTALVGLATVVAIGFNRRCRSIKLRGGGDGIVVARLAVATGVDAGEGVTAGVETDVGVIAGDGNGAANRVAGLLTGDGTVVEVGDAALTPSADGADGAGVDVATEPG